MKKKENLPVERCPGSGVPIAHGGEVICQCGQRFKVSGLPFSVPAHERRLVHTSGLSVKVMDSGDRVERGEIECAACRVRNHACGAEVVRLRARVRELEAAVEVALDAALGEVRRQGGPEYLLKEAREAGMAAARAR